MTFMGGVHSGVIDHPEWTKEQIDAEFARACP